MLIILNSKYMQDYKQILNEEKECCSCGGLKDIKEKASQAANKARERYESLEPRQKKQLFAVIAGAAALLFSLLALRKMKNSRKDD